MNVIPTAKIKKETRITQNNIRIENKHEKVLFSFEAVEKNEYFNLDGTCQNWAADLFDTLQKVSGIELKDIYAGKYSGKTSPFRIHRHGDANPPCKIPPNISLEDMWQIRISISKGGIHGIFSDNIFYVVWFDPQHNLYPDKNHGGLKKVIPPSTCCKDRDIEIEQLKEEIDRLQKDCEFWESYAQEKEETSNIQGV